MKKTIMTTMAVTLLTAAAEAQVSAPDAVVAAMGKARKDNMRVLLVSGDDGIRAQLTGPLSRLILYEYVKVELASDDKYADMFRPTGSEGAYLAVLDNRYRGLASKPVSELQQVESTKAFLEGNQAEHLDANAVYAKALSLARKTDRRVFVHLGAPW
jgi:hypothetical protein